MNKLEQTNFLLKINFTNCKNIKKNLFLKAVFATKPLTFRVYIQEIVTGE